MSELKRLSSYALKSWFLDWVAAQPKSAVQFITLEGLPLAGKSYLREKAEAAGVVAIELDRFLSEPANRNRSWVDQVTGGGAVEAIESRLGQGDLVLVEGSAVWPVIRPVVNNIQRSAVRRVYLKRMTIHGDLVQWANPIEEIAERAQKGNGFWRSIYMHHYRDEPWRDADLVIERVEET